MRLGKLHLEFERVLVVKGNLVAVVRENLDGSGRVQGRLDAGLFEDSRHLGPHQGTHAVGAGPWGASRVEVACATGRGVGRVGELESARVKGQAEHHLVGVDIVALQQIKVVGDLG